MVGHLETDLSSFALLKSTTLGDPKAPLAFDFTSPFDLGGAIVRGAAPNPSGMLGQVWVAVDPSGADRVYVLASVDPPGDDPLDVHLVRSVDGGQTWSAPIRVNDDPTDNGAWQWFGTLAVAPSGHLDAVWNDTRAAASEGGGGVRSVLYYAYSENGGVDWSPGEPLGPSWDPLVGFPNQEKIGDYYQLISFDDAAHLAYAATYNGEQDVYYLRIVPTPAETPLFADGFEAGTTSGWSDSSPSAGDAPGLGISSRATPAPGPAAPGPAAPGG